MTKPSSDNESLQTLLAELLDGQLSDQEIERLRNLLREDPEARELYFRHITTHAMLHWKFSTPITAQDKSGTIGLSHLGEGKLEANPPSAAQPEGPTTSKPAIFGFLENLGGAFSTPPLLFSLIIVLAAVGLAVLFGIASSRRGHVGQPVVATTSIEPRNSGSALVGPTTDRPVARVSAVANCVWGPAPNCPHIGDPLFVGQALHLTSGVVELTYDLGARVVIQSPAEFSLSSAKALRMESGKLAAEITSKQARGFEVITQEARFVDQGTEFGVEVAPGGNSRVHVFQGEVDLSLNSKNGVSLPTQRLLANSGARLEGEEPRVTFFEDTGESFVRSIDELNRDDHIIAYWRFEDHTVGTLLSDTQRNSNPVCATSDSTYNGNDLFVWSPESRPTLSSEIPFSVVPQTGTANHGCLDLTDPTQSNKTRPEVYTNSQFSHASPCDIQKITPQSWTVEASVKVKQLNGARQVILSRDGTPGKAARLSLFVNSHNRFDIRFADVDERFISVAADDFTVTENQWYHLAARSDGKELRLYVDSLDGKGYQLVGTGNLPSDGSTALGSCGSDCSWAVGRQRLQKGSVGDALVGWIDEVRICDVALEPADFLFAPKRKAASADSHVSSANDTLRTTAEIGN